MILAFYPKAFTSGCTKQNRTSATGTRTSRRRARRCSASRPTDVETQKRFKAELKLPYPLLSDEGGKVAKQYAGTMAVVGVANRANFVIGQDGL